LSYLLRPIDDNHQLLCAIHRDRGFIVAVATLIYQIHNAVLALLLRLA
jgi:hypothetical protein